MSTVIMHNVVSVDGFIADAQDHVGPLFDWLSNGDAELVDGGAMKVSQASAEYVRPMWASIGSMVIGRHLFDMTNGWEGSPPSVCWHCGASPRLRASAPLPGSRAASFPTARSNVCLRT